MLTSSTQILQCALVGHQIFSKHGTISSQPYECNCVGAADHVIVQHASKASRSHTTLNDTTKDSYKHYN